MYCIVCGENNRSDCSCKMPYFAYGVPGTGKVARASQCRTTALANWIKRHGSDVPDNIVLVAAMTRAVISNAWEGLHRGQKNGLGNKPCNNWWVVEPCPCGCGNETCLYDKCRKARLRDQKKLEAHPCAKFTRGKWELKHVWIFDDGKWICDICCKESDTAPIPPKVKKVKKMKKVAVFAILANIAVVQSRTAGDNDDFELAQDWDLFYFKMINKILEEKPKRTRDV